MRSSCDRPGKPRRFAATKSRPKCAKLFDVINPDEEHLARLIHFLEARKEQTLRQVDGFLRGVEQACRDCAAQGTQTPRKQTLVLDHGEHDFGDASIGSGISRTKWKRSFAKSVQPQVENAIQLLETDLRGLWPQLQDMIETHFGGEVKTQRRAPRQILPGNAGSCCNRFSWPWSSEVAKMSLQNNWGQSFGKRRIGSGFRRAWRQRVVWWHWSQR